MINWSNEKRNIADLIPADYNPRKISDAQAKQLATSIDRFDVADPIIINLNNRIIGGHMRWRMLKELGYTTVDVRVPDVELTLEQEKELNLRLNKNTGEFDFDSLATNFDMDMLMDVGFDESELKGLFDVETQGDDDVPEPPAEPIAKLGDIWMLGKHRVMCGDSTMIDDVEKLMDGKKADMLLTDPPYNVDYTGKTKEALKIDNDNKEDESFREFLRDALVCADAFMKGGAVFYIWHADSEGYNFRGACRDVMWKVRQCLIWNKNTMVMGRQDYHWKHEPCLYGWKDGDGHIWNSDRKQTTILEFDRPTKSTEHPTMKPVGLLEYQMRNNTKFEDLVMDLFLGSGSTLIACEKTNRICYGMELEPKYVDVIVKRWEDFTGKKAERVVCDIDVSAGSCA